MDFVPLLDESRRKICRLISRDGPRNAEDDVHGFNSLTEHRYRLGDGIGERLNIAR